MYYMVAHLHTHHISLVRARPIPPTLPLPLMREYGVAFPRMDMAIDCPVKVCPGRVTSRTNLQFYFMHWHVEDTILVINKGPGPQPQCDQCGMFIPWGEMTLRHLGNAICKISVERKRRHISSTSIQVSACIEFRAQYQVLENVETFNCLGRILSCNDRDWPSVAWNLQRERIKWGQLSSMLFQ